MIGFLGNYSPGVGGKCAITEVKTSYFSWKYSTKGRRPSAASASTLKTWERVLFHYPSSLFFQSSLHHGSWPPALKSYLWVVFSQRASPRCRSRPELFRLQHLLLWLDRKVTWGISVCPSIWTHTTRSSTLTGGTFHRLNISVPGGDIDGSEQGHEPCTLEKWGTYEEKNNKMILKVHEVKKHSLWLFFNLKSKLQLLWNPIFNTAQREKNQCF